jgi:flavorubredoxin
MSKAIQINDQVSWIGVNDHDTGLFEELWPMPHGITYNSYLVRDERTALIDAVKGSFQPAMWRGSKLPETGQRSTILSSIISNPTTPGDQGSAGCVPESRSSGTGRPPAFADFYGITENLRIVEDGDELNLGAIRSNSLDADGALA